MDNTLEDLLGKLVTFQSDNNHPQEIEKCFDFVKQYVKDSGLSVRTYSSNNFPSLIVAKKEKKHYQYMLVGHLDVVPAEYSHAFQATKKGNRLYARGTGDMKGAVAAMLQLMRELGKDDVDVALMLTSDEEIGGKNGVDYLLNKERYSCDCVIIPDGGNNFHLVLQQKGILHVKLTIQGKSAHGSRPWLGDNAVEKIFEVYTIIKKHFPIGQDKEHWQTTVNLGKLLGGSAVNMVAESADMYLDFRYISDKEKKRILIVLEELVHQTKGLSFEITLAGDEMNVSSKNSYIRKFIQTAMQEGITLIPEKSHTASDGRFFSVKKIPVIMTSPICSKGHIADEWIDMKSLEDYYKLLRNFLKT